MDRFIFNLTKLLLYIMSLFIIILAVTILVLSILTAQRTTINNRQIYAPEKSIIIKDFHFLISICTGGSIGTIFISLYGIYAIYHESNLFLLIHCLLLLLIHTCSLLIGSAIFFDERQIGAPASLFFKAHYNYALLIYSYQSVHNTSGASNDLFRYGTNPSTVNISFDIVLDRVHQRLHCCGLMGIGDFTELHVPIPPSCFYDHGLSYRSSCLFKFRLESVSKAQTFAICIYMMGVLTLVSCLIDLVLLREFLQDRLLEHIIDRLTNFSSSNEKNSQQQRQSQLIKPQVQQYVVDYLLESPM